MNVCAMRPALVRKGIPVIVGDEDLEDRYIADLESSEIFENRNPIVKVRFVLRYPIQHAICWKDVINEHRPIDEGLLCRLHLYGVASPEQLARFGSYADSLKQAQKRALLLSIRYGRTKETEIILRHLNGDYKGRRYVISFGRWEL